MVSFLKQRSSNTKTDLEQGGHFRTATSIGSRTTNKKDEDGNSKSNNNRNDCSCCSALQVCGLILINLLLWGRITSQHVDVETMDSVLLNTVGTDTDTVYTLLSNATESVTQLYASYYKDIFEHTTVDSETTTSSSSTTTTTTATATATATATTSDAAATTATTATATTTEAAATTTTNDDDSINTSIVITSTGVPSFFKLENMLDSIQQNLKGLPSKTPIYVSIESANPQELNALKNEAATISSSAFPIHWITNPMVLGHVVTIKQGVDKIPNHHFVYVLQIQMIFTKAIDHVKLVQSMQQHKDVLRCIRFRMEREPEPAPCSAAVPSHIRKLENGLSFFHTASFTDGNQFATKDFYDQILPAIGPTPRPLFQPMAKVVAKDCNKWGQTLYDASNTPYVLD